MPLTPDAPVPCSPPSSSPPGNGRHSRKQWWRRLPIPDSWHIADADERDTGRDHYRGERERERDRGERDRGDPRDREPLDLDDTRSSYRRRYDDGIPPGSGSLPPSFPASSQPRIQVPLSVAVSLLIYLVGQLIGGVWWAATIQAGLQHEIADRAKEESRLWDNVQTYRLEVQQLRVEIARNQTQIRNIKQEQEDN